jgi:hypothetical protein
MADLPGGASGLLCRDYKGKEAEKLVTRIEPAVFSLVAELRRPRAPDRRGIAPVEDPRRGASRDRRLAGGYHPRHDQRPVRRRVPTLHEVVFPVLNAVGLLKGPRATGRTFRRNHRPENPQPQFPRRGDASAGIACAPAWT